MRLDEFEGYIAFFMSQMKQTFGDSIELLEIKKELNYHGYFFLKYYHFPTKLFVLIESEYGLFTVRIEQEDSSFNNLNRIEPFDNYLSSDINASMEKIEKSIRILKDALSRPISFYKAMNDGLYRKEGTEAAGSGYQCHQMANFQPSKARIIKLT